MDDDARPAATQAIAADARADTGTVAMTSSFPPYSYVPGKFPHPHSDPHGHRFGAGVASPDTPLAPDWPTSLHHRLAVDLFNHGYYWEAHEFWEMLWHAAGRSGVEAAFIKALIQLAVVGVKLREGRRDGALAHARRAGELLATVQCQFTAETIAGLSVATLIAQVESLRNEMPEIECNDQAVEIVLPIRL